MPFCYRIKAEWTTLYVSFLKNVIYSTSEKEALAMVWALQHFDVCVEEDTEVLVYSDHNLIFLHSLQSPNFFLDRYK